ncbi:MAG: SoxR reducing system RseC family protein [Spirochaetaceae bacterium]
MNSTAIVNRIEQNEIYLMHITDFGDKEKTERKFWNIKKLDFKVINPEEYNLEEGDAVEYFIPEGKTILATFIVLILPLVTFLVTYGILIALGLKSEKVAALISLVMMAGSFLVTKLIKKLGYKETLPTITKIMSKESLNKLKEECKDCGSCTACN